MHTFEEEEKLLPEETLGTVQQKKQNARRKCLYVIIAVYIVALHIALATSLFTNTEAFDATTVWENKTRLQILRSRLRRIAQDDHATSFTEYTAYSGPPRPENSAAWKGLLQNLYFNATKEEVITEGGDAEQSIQVKGGGYLAALGVHHELHCLNKIRFFLYSHRTQQTWNQEDMKYWYRHLDHCVEVLRLSVMCTSDLSLYTFTWPKDNNSEFLDLHSRSQRQCGDWNQVEQWSHKKQTSMQKGLLVPEEALS